jgi:hypothetical protein
MRQARWCSHECIVYRRRPDNDPFSRLFGCRRRNEARSLLVEQLDQQLVAIPHVMVDRGRADAELTGKTSNRQLLPAVPVDHLAGRRKDL